MKIQLQVRLKLNDFGSAIASLNMSLQVRIDRPTQVVAMAFNPTLEGVQLLGLQLLG